MSFFMSEEANSLCSLDLFGFLEPLRKWQLQQEMAAMLRQRSPKASGLQLLQELEQAPERSERFQQAQARLRRELESSQQQNKEEFLLQQLELEMELERELKKKEVPKVSLREQELRLKVQQMLQSLAHMSWNVSVADEEQRTILWTYLQAELLRPKEEPRKGRGKQRPVAGPLLGPMKVLKSESKKEMPPRPRRHEKLLWSSFSGAREPKPEPKPSSKAPAGVKRGGISSERQGRQPL